MSQNIAPPANVKWIKAEKGEGLSIVYFDQEGNKLIRRKDPNPGSLKGSKAWRHNNPGNLVSGPFVKQHGSIGSASYSTKNEQGKEQKYTFAIFPSYEVGRTAMALLFKEPKYSKLTLEALPRKYTGIEDGKPDTKEAIAYRDFLKKATKLDMKRTIESLNEDEFNTLIQKMENYEGWHPWAEGEEFIPVQKIIGVKMNHHKVTDFLILSLTEKRWITRAEAINLAENQLLRAVVVHNKKQTYLRPFPHETPYRDLVC
ncbi:MAG: hypothetical protein FJZ59_02065 [Chlamydiae bacterium]|nr:hypothetical protein [Chlamydiota bacterium]